jgi:hypothetical protein
MTVTPDSGIFLGFDDIAIYRIYLSYLPVLDFQLTNNKYLLHFQFSATSDDSSS